MPLINRKEHKRSHVKRKKYIVLVLFIVFASCLVFTHRTSAELAGLPQILPESTSGYRPYIHLTTGSNNNDTGAGAWSDTSSIKVYASSNVPRTFRLTFPNNTCTNLDNMTYTMYRINDANNTLDPLYNDNLSCASNYSDITVPSAAFQLSNVKGREGIYVAMVRLTINASSNGDPRSTSFRAQVFGSTGIGFMGVYPTGGARLVGEIGNPAQYSEDPGPVKRGLTATSIRSGTDGGATYDVGADFAPSCEFFGSNHSASKSVNVYWKDADSRDSINGGNPAIPNSGQPVTIKVYDKANLGSPIASWDGGGGSAVYSGQINVQYGHKYYLKAEGLYKGNGMVIWYPFDTSGTSFNCPPEPLPPNANCTRFGAMPNRFKIKPHSKYRFSYYPSSNTGTLNNWTISNGTYIKSSDSVYWTPNDGWSAVDYVTNSSDDTDDYYYDFPAPTAEGWIIKIERWDHSQNLRDLPSPAWDGREWRYSHDSEQVHGCYVATCDNLNIVGDKPSGGSAGALKGGAGFSVSGLVHNTGSQPLPTHVFVDGGGYPQGYQDIGTVNNGANGFFNVWMGGSRDSVESHGLTVRIIYGNSSNNFTVTSCPITLNTYKHFTLSPTPTIDYDSDEDPTDIMYKANVSYNGPAGRSVAIGSSASFSGPSGVIASGSSGGPYGNIDVLPTGHYAPPSVNAGDTYRTHLHVDWTDGWVGPLGAGDLLDLQVPYDNSVPMTVVNKPYFKTYGSGVKAGGGFVGAGNGEISAWTNNVDGTFPYGSGAQLVAFANGDITGFASAQGVAGLSTSSLSFANNSVSVNTGTYSPRLGGNFNNTHASTVIDVKPTEGSPAGGILGGRTVNGNQAIESSEDIYITGNITYGSGPWTADSIPSFVLSTTGNIYIAPNVTRLDGIYTSQRANGAIYTCSKNSGGGNFDPISANVPADNFFSTCKNQLLVHGSFVADKIHLMRTYGSLRDEKPTPTTTPTPVRYTRNTNYCFGENDALTTANCRAAGYTNCIRIDEAYNPGYPYVWWSDNWLCNRPSDGVIMQWTPAGANLALPKCANWSPGGRDNSGWAWSDNKLCISGSKNISFQSSNQTTVPNSFGEYQRYCVHLYDASDPNTGGFGGGAWLCEEQTVTDPGSDGSPHANVADPCSNGISVGAIRVDTRTCAAEVFDFSPDLYLSNPAIELPGRSKLRFDSITSLPPIL